MIEIDPRSIDRLATNSVMVARVNESGANIEEGATVDIGVDGVKLATGTVNAVIAIEQFPDVDDPGQANLCRGFMADLQKEGLVVPGTRHDSDEGRELIIEMIERMNARGVGAYRIEYTPNWNPVEGWEGKIKGRAEIKDDDSLVQFPKQEADKVEDPDADKFKSAAEMADETESEYVNGGVFSHAGNDYLAFGVEQKSRTMQGEAIHSGIEPRVVQVSFDQVRGWRAPITLGEFEEKRTDHMDPAELANEYDQAIEACRQLARRVEHVEAEKRALADPTKSIAIDLSGAINTLRIQHDPARNRPLDEIVRHYVATVQLLTATVANDMAKQWNAFDHVVNDNDHLDDVTCKMAITSDFDASDLIGAATTNGKVTLKFSAKGGYSTSIQQALAQASKTPDEPELALRFEPGEGEEVPAEDEPEPTPEPEEPLGGDGEKLWLCAYGVQISQAFFAALTDEKQRQVNLWVAKMQGEVKGVKKFPSVLKSLIMEYEKYSREGRDAFKAGDKITSHGLTTGTGEHLAWSIGYKTAQAAA